MGERKPEVSEPILKVVGLRKQFSGMEVLKGIDLTVMRGERHAIIGPNGAGKTTLFNLITGGLRADGGKIIFDGKDITHAKPHQINRMGVARSFQITNIFPGLTVFENVFAAILSKHGKRMSVLRSVERMKDLKEECEELLRSLGLLGKKDFLAGKLAYGEQRVLEIGLTIATDPSFIALDEPTAGMSIDETKEMIEFIEKISEGKTLLIVEHDMEVVFSLSQKITVIHYGEIIASGPPDEIRRNDRVKEAYLGEKI